MAIRAFGCVFIGYADNSKTYRFYNLNNHVIIEYNDANLVESFLLNQEIVGVQPLLNGAYLVQVNKHSLIRLKLISNQEKVKEPK